MRHQRGHVYQAAGVFYVRYYRDATAAEIAAGKSSRLQESQRLCAKDKVHYSTKCKPVRDRAAQFMQRVNAQSDSEPPAVTVREFWTNTYLPRAKRRLHESTVRGYEDVWRRLLEPEMGEVLLTEYTPQRGTRFLNRLALQYSKYTVKGAHSLASGIFRHAAAEIEGVTNPWHDAKCTEDPQPTEDTTAYTQEEIEDIISALADRVDCQLIMALAYFAGLSRSEIRGLKWEDLDDQWIHVRRGYVFNRAEAPKTKNRTGRVPLIEPCRTFVALWHHKSGSPTAGWVFPNSLGRAMDMKDLAGRVIRPMLAKAGCKWKGFHAARRSCGTRVMNQAGPLVGARWLRNSPAIALKHYHKPEDDLLLPVAKQLEASNNSPAANATSPKE